MPSWYAAIVVVRTSVTEPFVFTRPPHASAGAAIDRSAVMQATTVSERRAIEDLLGFVIHRADRDDPGTTTGEGDQVPTRSAGREQPRVRPQPVEPVAPLRPV